MSMLTRRTITPEHMDAPDIDREELDRALRFLRTVNRRLGGIRAAIRPIQQWSRHLPVDRPIRILDVGTGSADIPIALAQWAVRNNRSMHITAADNHPTTLDLARENIGKSDRIELVQADATRLDEIYEADSFDYAHAGLFLHHLPDIEVMTVLRIMQRLASRALIWNDLVRGTLPRVGVRLCTRGAPAVARHDALVSVDAGFTKNEAVNIARRVGLTRITYRRHLIYRFTLTSEKHVP